VAADWFPIDEIIDAGLKQVDRSGSADSISVELSRDALLVYADPTLLTQLLFNLLDNAQHHAAGSEIILKAGQVGRAVRIEVMDRGPGLGDDPSKLLSRFERGDAKSSRGVGLGLTICKAIAEAHGGSLQARNRSAGGAEFVVTLPYPSDTQPPVADSEPDNPESNP
jgi:two-component system sensor histidine kinase KdpD